MARVAQTHQVAQVRGDAWVVDVRRCELNNVVHHDGALDVAVRSAVLAQIMVTYQSLAPRALP
ncbi:MAG: hypothetical protein RSB98_00865 [Raoultibacter sp.]